MRLLFASLLIVLLPVLCLAQNSRGDQLFQLAKEILEKDDFEKAAKTFLEARKEFLKEKNYQRYFSATQAATIIYQDTGDGPASEKIILEALQMVPTGSAEHQHIHAKLYDNLGYTYLYVTGEPTRALEAYDTSLQWLSKAGKDNSVDAAFELVNRAAVLAQLYQYEKSVADLSKAIAIYKNDSGTEPAQLASLYQTLGNNYREQGRFDDAIASIQKGIAILKDSDDVAQVASFYNDLGISFLGKDAYTEAIENIELAVSLNEKAYGKDADHYAQSLINLSNAYEAGGDLEKSLATFQEIASIYSQTPPSNDQDLIDVLLNLGRITNNLGLLEQSQLVMDQALQLAEQKFGKESIPLADVLMSFASTTFSRGEYDVSLSQNFKALSILDQNQFEGAETYGIIYNNIGQAYDELFETDLALQYKEQALARYQKANGQVHKNVATALENIGLTYEMAGNNDKALEYLQQALAMKVKILGDRHEETGITYLNIGFVFLKKLDHRQAIANLEKARVIYDSYPRHKMKAMIYNRLGAAHALAKEPAKAVEDFQKAITANCLNLANDKSDILPDRPDYLSYYELVISALSKVDLLTRLNDRASLEKAQAFLTTADKILLDKALHMNNAKDRLELAQANFFFTEVGMNWARQYYQLTKDPAHLEKAFYYSERNKANELLADLKQMRNIGEKRIPKKWAGRQKEIAVRMHTLEQQVASAYQSKNLPLITKLKSQQLDLEREAESVQQQIETTSPGLSITRERKLPSWKEVQKTLDAKTALVSFTITDSARFAWVGTQTTQVLLPLSTKSDLDKLIRGYRNFITFKNDAFTQVAARLYLDIWKPVQNKLEEFPGIENLIIMTDGPLSYLPFETLGDDKPLLTKYDIRYELSAAMLMAKGARPVIRKPSFIALAPVFSDEATSFVNKSCEPIAKATNATDSTSRSFSQNGDYIAPLPATEKEVEQIHRIHLDKDLFSKFFTKENASEELIKKGELNNYDIIHLATHGIANSQYPELSALLLTANKASQEDGVLYTGEILGLNLKADLVTLSACETALGKRIQGEGVRGLTSSFLLAGARTVVVSLWKVADESTSLLMIEFYNQLLSGQSKSAALRAAKLKLMADPTYRHPYYWAPFIQVGQN